VKLVNARLNTMWWCVNLFLNMLRNLYTHPPTSHKNYGWATSIYTEIIYVTIEVFSVSWVSSSVTLLPLLLFYWEILSLWKLHTFQLMFYLLTCVKSSNLLFLLDNL
jgi:hypothetical protein